VPLIIGNTADEYSTLIDHYLAAPIANDADYRAQIAHWFPAAASTIVQRYPSSAYTSPQQALIAVMTDDAMVCPARRIARAVRASQSEPVRRYMFDHVYESGPWVPLRAGHGLDLAFEFGNLGLHGFIATAAERALSDSIIGYWTRFAAMGDPNGSDAVAWPIYEVATDPALQLDDAITDASGVRTSLCDFWDAVQ
jgi:para-nitrobenzyl esterase